MRLAATTLGLFAALVVATMPAEARVITGNFTTDQIRLLIAGFTFLTHDEAAANRLEYAADDGRAYLLLPKADTVVVGRWKLRYSADRKSVLMCFRYKDEARSPAIRKPMDDWACESAEAFRARSESSSGDKFKLAKSSASHPALPLTRTSFWKLLPGAVLVR